MPWPRLRPPPPLCDCVRRTTCLERGLWWVRARLHRWRYGRTQVKFSTITGERIYTRHDEETLERREVPLHEILAENSVKEDADD